MGTTPRVSVIVPTHNREVLLAEALGSVQRQTVSGIELIVVDDGSEPEVSQDNLRSKYGEQVRVLRHAHPRGGAAAKNTGACAATTDVLAFLDDDDLYAPDYLARALSILARYASIQVVFMGVSWFGRAGEAGQAAYEKAMTRTLADARGKELEPGVVHFSNDLVAALLSSVPMAFQRPVVRRSAFEHIGGYVENCLLWDCDWAIRAAMDVPTALVSDRLYCQRADGQGFSSKRDRRLEHLQSGVEIRDRLLYAVRRVKGNRDEQRLFAKAAAKGWFDLAYHYASVGDRREAFRAWLTSQLRCADLSRMKFLGRLLLLGLNRFPGGESSA